MRRHMSKRKHRIYNIIAIFSFVLALSLFLLYHQIGKNIDEICEYKCKATANRIITDVISQNLEGSEEQYIKIIRDGSKIQSIETNSAAVNKTQNEIKEAINNNLSSIMDNKIKLPLGTVSGINFLSGRGPDLSLELYQLGSVDTELKSEFKSAGINQTKYKIYLTVKLELSAVMPGYSIDIKINNDYLMSETVIVGDMPNMYLGTNLLSDS